MRFGRLMRCSWQPSLSPPISNHRHWCLCLSTSGCPPLRNARDFPWCSSAADRRGLTHCPGNVAFKVPASISAATSARDRSRRYDDVDRGFPEGTRDDIARRLRAMIPRCVLRTTYYVLRTTYYVLRTTYYVLRTTYYVLRTSRGAVISIGGSARARLNSEYSLVELVQRPRIP